VNADALWLLLSTVDSGGLVGESTKPDQVDPRTLEAALDLAKVNGLHYAFVQSWIAVGGQLPEREASRRAGDRRAIAGLQSSIDILNDVSQELGIDYAVIKDVQTIDHVPRDLDIFVPEADRKSFLEGLLSRGYAFVYNDGAEVALGRPRSMRIDVYSRIHYLGRDFLDEAYLLGASAAEERHGRTYPGLTPEAAFLLDSIHGIFGHGAISLLDFLELRNLRIRAGDDGRLRVRAATFGWAGVYDLWRQRLSVLSTRVFIQRIPTEFPNRIDARFLLEAVGQLDGDRFTSRDRIALRASVAWDRIILLGETTGIQDRLVRSALVRSLANAAGHRLRTFRGDRKNGLRAIKRAREGG